jgi:ribosomal protein S18 acetylase RimI-like enzyme
MNVEIRVLSESDAEAMRQLRLRAVAEEPASFGETAEEYAAVSLPDVAKKLKNSKDSFILGAFTPELTAMLGFYRRPGVKMRHKAVIWGIYVSPESRGKQLGQALLLDAISRASKIPDLEYLTLAVGTMNTAALNLYLSLGFRPYGMEHSALKIDGSYIDEEFLELDLSKQTIAEAQRILVNERQ